MSNEKDIMDMTLENLKRELQSKKTRYDECLVELSELGFNTVEDAKRRIEQLEKEIEKKESDLNSRTSTLHKQITDAVREQESRI